MAASRMKTAVRRSGRAAAAARRRRNRHSQLNDIWSKLKKNKSIQYANEPQVKMTSAVVPSPPSLHPDAAAPAPAPARGVP